MDAYTDRVLEMKDRSRIGRWNCKREILTLGKLAEEEKHTYWKFSQSEKGRSIEAPYIEYIEGEIAIARDKDKLLSFVNEQNIVECYMYGDILTDNTNKKFKEIVK